MTKPKNLKQAFIVTGGAGFIGSHLSDALLSHGHIVTVIDNLSTGKIDNLSNAQSFPQFNFIEKDAAEVDWYQLLPNHDSVFHLAASVGVTNVHKSGLDTAKNNRGSLEKLLEAATKYKTRIIYSSTSEVYGNIESKGAMETNILQTTVQHGGRSAFTLAKMYGELLCLGYFSEFAVPTTVLRLFNTIGSRQVGEYGMVVPKFINLAASNQPIPVYGDGGQTRCFCSVSDVVAAMISVLNFPKTIGQIYNIGSSDQVSILELAEFICQQSNSNSNIHLQPFPPERTYPTDIRHRRPNISKIKQHTGWQPSSDWKSIIQQLIQMEKVNVA